MTNIRLLAALLLASALFGPMATAQSADGSTTEEAKPADATPADPDLVIATVNGEDVTLGDLVALRAELPPQYQSIPDGPLYDGLVEQLANQILLRQAAERTGVADRPSVKRGLAFQRTSYLAELYVRERLNEQIDEATLQRAYEARYVNAEKAVEYKARHILLTDEETAKEVAEAAKAEGADFAEIANEKSTGPSGPAGGDLGWFGKGMMVPEFEEVVVGLENGQVSDPVKTQFGWHVILREDSREAPVPPLAEVQGELIGELTREVTEGVVTALRDEADIEVKDGQPGIDQLRNDALISDE